MTAQIMRDHAPRLARGYVPGKLTLPSWRLTTAPLADVREHFPDAGTPSSWNSPLLPEDGHTYNERGVMIPRDPATALDADGEPIF